MRCHLHETSLSLSVSISPHQSPHQKSHIYAPPPPICNCNHEKQPTITLQSQPLTNPLIVQLSTFPTHRPLTADVEPLLTTHLHHPTHPTLRGCIELPPLVNRTRYKLSSTRYINARIITSNGDSSRPMTMLSLYYPLLILYFHYYPLTIPHTILTILTIPPHTFSYLHTISIPMAYHVSIPIPSTAAYAHSVALRMSQLSLLWPTHVLLSSLSNSFSGSVGQILEPCCPSRFG